MKKEIHPVYYPEAEVRCACGAVFRVGATKKSFEVEVCSNCHPFFTGQNKLIDTAGRVERLQEKIKKTREIRAQRRILSKTQKRRVKKQAEQSASKASSERKPKEKR